MAEPAESRISLAAARRIGGWLFAATVVLILYGSLFPFRFEDDGRTLSRVLLELSFARTSRGDIVANLLLYAPLGFCAALVFAGRRPRLLALLAPVVCGVVLSVSIEMLQASSASRVSSLTDVVLNAIGTLAGAMAGALCARRIATMRFGGLEPGGTALAAISVVVLWLGFRLAPFVPTIDWQKYKDALKPLLIDPQVAPLSVFGYVVGWLVVDHSVRCLWRPAAAWRVFLLVAGAVVAGRIVIVDKAVSLSEVVALALCVPLVAVLAGRGDKRKAAALAVAAVAVVALQGLEPFGFSAQANAFSWVPFRLSIMGGLEIGYTVLFEKAFWYTSIIWLLTRAGTTLGVATFATFVLLGVVEIAQIWLPGRSPEITDPLLALGLAWLLRVLAGSDRA